MGPRTGRPPPEVVRVAYPLTQRKVEQQNACWTGYFARFHTISNVNPASVRGFVNFISSAVMDVMIRR
jgi:hypothetical protein